MAKREEKWKETVPGVDKENGEECMPWSVGWVGTLAMPRVLGCRLLTRTRRCCPPWSGSDSLWLYSGCSAASETPQRDPGGRVQGPNSNAPKIRHK